MIIGQINFIMIGYIKQNLEAPHKWALSRRTRGTPFRPGLVPCSHGLGTLHKHWLYTCIWLMIKF